MPDLQSGWDWQRVAVGELGSAAKVICGCSNRDSTGAPLLVGIALALALSPSNDDSAVRSQHLRNCTVFCSRWCSECCVAALKHLQEKPGRRFTYSGDLVGNAL